MVVGELAEQVDLLIVGGGPGGYAAAAHAAQIGREVVLVDRAGAGGLGGACLHVGCIPSKAMIELANGYEAAAAHSVPGLSITGARVDLEAWQAWKDELRAGLAAGVESLMGDRGVRVIQGEARFSKRDRAAVQLPDGSAQFLEFRHAIVATGARPATLPALEPDGDRVLDSTGALALDRLPANVAVVGAGYIGLELGTALAKLGTKVSIVEAADRILPALDPALTRPVLRSLERLEVDLHLSSKPTGLEGANLVVEGSAGTLRVPADKVIVAVGRRPNTEQLGLDRAGVTVGADGLIPVDAGMISAVRTVAAVGDVVDGPALAHKASAEGVVAAESLSGMPAAFEPAAIPVVAFTDPEIASAGMTQAEAEASGLDLAVSISPLRASGRAWTLRAPDGFVRVVADRESDRVIGVQIAAPHASELIGAAVVAIEMMASPRDLAESIHPHPTLSEGLPHAADQMVVNSPAGR